MAVARALAGQPEIIFGDEPTGNLDSRSGAEVLGFLRRSVDELGQTFVMVTHDPSAAAYADRVLFLADGRIVDDMGAPTADKVLDRMRQFDATATLCTTRTRAATRSSAETAGGKRSCGRHPAATSSRTRAGCGCP